MHTLTVKWLIQLPSLWLESWNLARLQHWMQCYELQTYSAHITAASRLLTSFSPPPPVLVWPLVAAWCWGGLAPESLWGWGPWGGHGLASAGPVSAEGTWRQEVQGPAQQQSSWGWPGPGGRFTLLPTGRHHPPVGPPRDAADTSDGPAFLSSSGTCSHVCAPQGLWSFTWMDP